MKWRMDERKTGEAMLRAGMDLRTLAKVTGITPKAATDAVRGISTPKNSTIKKICDALGVDAVSVCVPAGDDEKGGQIHG